MIWNFEGIFGNLSQLLSKSLLGLFFKYFSNLSFNSDEDQSGAKPKLEGNTKKVLRILIEILENLVSHYHV